MITCTRGGHLPCNGLVTSSDKLLSGLWLTPCVQVVLSFGLLGTQVWHSPQGPHQYISINKKYKKTAKNTIGRVSNQTQPLQCEGLKMTAKAPMFQRYHGSRTWHTPTAVQGDMWMLHLPCSGICVHGISKNFINNFIDSSHSQISFTVIHRFLSLHISGTKASCGNVSELWPPNLPKVGVLVAQTRGSVFPPKISHFYAPHSVFPVWKDWGHPMTTTAIPLMGSKLWRKKPDSRRLGVILRLFGAFWMVLGPWESSANGVYLQQPMLIFLGNQQPVNNCMLIPKNQVNDTKATACCNQLFFCDLVAQVARIYAPGDLSLVNGDSCLQSFTAVR